MPENEGDELEVAADGRKCRLDLELFWYGGVHTSYNAKADLDQSLHLKGRIYDPQRDFWGRSWSAEPASAFHDKPVDLSISRSFDQEWWERKRAELGVPDACGRVEVRAGVEPERVEPEFGEPHEVEPVQICLFVSADAFDAIWRQVAETDGQGRMMLGYVTLISDSFPHEWYCRLEDVDVSEDREYAIGSFEISGGHVDPLRGRMRRIERGRDETYGANIKILVTETSCDFSAAHGRPTSMACEGRVIETQGEPYDCANVKVEFSEHRGADTYYKIDERSYFGEFSYRPERDSFPTRFDINLWLVSEDDWGLLIPLLTRGADTRIFLIVNLTSEETELIAATDRLQGNVRDYSFEVSRTLVDYGTVLVMLEDAMGRLDNAMSKEDFQNTPLLNKGVEDRRFRGIRRWLLGGRWVMAGAGGMARLDRLFRELSRDQLAELAYEVRDRL